MKKRAIAIKEQTDNPSINIALDTIGKNKQALIFANTKSSAEKTAEDISLKIQQADAKLEKLSYDILNVLSRPTKQCTRLAMCVKKGIAFHHAGLAAKQREMIEDAFREGAIKVICSTPTLAAGLDLPAFRTVLKDLKRFGYHGLSYIPVLEYLQMAGRAGRPKWDTFGEAICVAKSDAEKDELWEQYVMGEPEPIYSKLAVEPVLRTYLLSLIVANVVRKKEQIMAFFEKTFWAFQYKDMQRLEAIIEKMLHLLEEWEFVKISGSSDGFRSADEASDYTVKPTLLGQRVAELYIDPLTANFLITCLRKAGGKQPELFSLLQMVSHTLEMRPLLRVKVKEYDEINEKLVENEGILIDSEPAMFDEDYDDFLSSIKTALFMHEWCDEKDEEYLLEKFSIRPGEIKVKLDLADWLLYSSSEMCRILQFQPLLKEIAKARLRLQYGVKEELLPLLKLKNIGRVRARKLFSNRIRTLGDVKDADLMVLVQILGKAVALDVKKQVGQDIEKAKVPEGKRKGQISLGDY